MTPEIGSPEPSAQISGLIFGMILLDPGSIISEANHAAESMLGISARRLLGKPVLDAIEIVDRRVRQYMLIPDAPLIARGVVMKTGETERTVNLTLSPLTSHPGWRVMTINDPGQAEMTFESESDPSALAAPAILAHEIKNPLSAIRGAGQLVARKLEDKDKPLARMITDEVDRIARLVDRMQRLGSRTRDPVAAINLHEAIRAAIATVRAANPSGPVIIEEFDPSLPLVQANRDALEQVLINLVSNASEACSGEEDPQVIVRTRFVSGLVLSMVRFGRAVKLPIEITVADNGPGIDETLHGHIFEPFVTSKKSGQGLGLALVRKLVRDMGGSIGHDRDKGAGLTQFRINLPMAKDIEN